MQLQETIYQSSIHCIRPRQQGKKFIQKVCGKLLYLGCAINSTILVPNSAIAAETSKPTTNTLAQMCQLLNYLAMQEEAVLTNTCRDTKLAVHSDASYLSKTKVHCRAGGHFFLSFDKKVHKTTAPFSNLPTLLSMLCCQQPKPILQPFTLWSTKQYTLW